MNIASIKAYCMKKKGAYEDLPFGPDVLVIKVCDRMFALISINNDKASISLKCDPFIAQDLRDRYAEVTPGYHLHKKHWNTVSLEGCVPDNEMYWMIDHSYDLVVSKLTKTQRKAL